MKFRNKFLAVFLILLPLPAQADLVKCGEVWTNGKCDSPPSQVLSLEESEVRSSEELALSVKRSLLHELTTTRLDLQKRYRFSMSQATADTLCLNPESSIAECRREIERIEKQLEWSPKIMARSDVVFGDHSPPGVAM